MIMLIVMAMMMVDLNYIEQSYIVLGQRQKNLKYFISSENWAFPLKWRQKKLICVFEYNLINWFLISANPRIIGPYSILSNHPISSSQNRYLGNPDLLAAIIFEIVQHLISPFILISDILKCPYHPIIPYCSYHPIIQYYPPKGNPDLGAALIKLSSFVAIARPLQPFPSQTVIINVIVIIAIIIIIVNE